MAILFISDLHLDPSRPAITMQFLNFLGTQAREAEALYILGDLFEAWIGDDEDSELAKAVRAGLRELSDSGVPIYVMRGNRDFLLGPAFAQDTGAQLLPDPCVLNLEGQPTLLMHGDLLCSDDEAYLAFRREVRQPAWRERFLGQSLEARRAFAGQARAASRGHQQGLRDEGKLEAITDVNEATVAATLERHGVRRMIHGHTHRPAIHSLQANGHTAQRVVLGDWYQQGSVLRLSGDGLELSAL
ncbi:MAG: UDP-2,3-diacylglucosamine diphosphatase [Frankiaceae bacterium]|nr:UDP-2,3-diacylglucosamine diphosphatase [Arenimonas sp.]